MMYTKGTFKDGTTGWKAIPYENKVGFATHEIHWSDDGECVAEVVHGEADAKLIAAAPEMFETLYKLYGSINIAASQNAVHAIETDEVNMIKNALSLVLGS